MSVKQKLAELSVAEIIEEFRKITPLPHQGVLTGQSLSSYIAYKLGVIPEFKFKDVDVFVDSETIDEDDEYIFLPGTLPDNSVPSGFRKAGIPLTPPNTGRTKESTLNGALSRTRVDPDYEDLINEAGYRIEDIYENGHLQIVALRQSHDGEEPSMDTILNQKAATLSVTSPIHFSTESQSDLDALVAACQEVIVPYAQQSESDQEIALLHKAFQWMIVQSFDLNLVQVGIDLYSKELCYTEGFVHYLETRQIIPVRGNSALRTLYRLLKKEGEGLGFVSESVKQTLAGVINTTELSHLYKKLKKTGPSFVPVVLDDTSFDQLAPATKRFLDVIWHLSVPRELGWDLSSDDGLKCWTSFLRECSYLSETYARRDQSQQSLSDALGYIKLGWVKASRPDEATDTVPSEWRVTIVPLTTENMAEFVQEVADLNNRKYSTLIVTSIEPEDMYKLSALDLATQIMKPRLSAALTLDLTYGTAKFNTTSWFQFASGLEELFKENQNLFEKPLWAPRYPAPVASSVTCGLDFVVRQLFSFAGCLQKEYATADAFSFSHLTEQGKFLTVMSHCTKKPHMDASDDAAVIAESGYFAFMRDHIAMATMKDWTHYSLPLRWSMLQETFEVESAFFYGTSAYYPILLAKVWNDYYWAFFGFNRQAFKSVQHRSKTLSLMSEHTELCDFLYVGFDMTDLLQLKSKLSSVLNHLGPIGKDLAESPWNLLTDLAAQVLAASRKEGTPDISRTVVEWLSHEMHQQILTSDPIPLPTLTELVDIVGVHDLAVAIGSSPEQVSSFLNTLSAKYAFVELTDAAALRREGSRMHHCVGGYASKVKQNRSRIISIRGPSKAESATAEWNFKMEKKKSQLVIDSDKPGRVMLDSCQLRSISNTAPTPEVVMLNKILLLACNHPENESVQSWIQSLSSSLPISPTFDYV